MDNQIVYQNMCQENLSDQDKHYENIVPSCTQDQDYVNLDQIHHPTVLESDGISNRSQENVQPTEDKVKGCIKKKILWGLVILISVISAISVLLAVTLVLTLPGNQGPVASMNHDSNHTNNTQHLTPDDPETFTRQSNVKLNIKTTQKSRPKFKLDLSIREVDQNIRNFISALPNGEALVFAFNPKTRISGVWKINQTGHFSRRLYTSRQRFISYMVLGESLLMLYLNGTVLQVALKTGILLDVYQLNVASDLFRHRILYSNSYSPVNPDIWPILNLDEHKLLIYNVSSRSIQKYLNNIETYNPRFISYYKYNCSLYSFVPDARPGHIYMFDSNWDLVKIIDVTGADSVVPTAEGSLMVCRTHLADIVEISLEGEVLGSVLNINEPRKIGFIYPYLLVMVSKCKTSNLCIFRYKMLKVSY